MKIRNIAVLLAVLVLFGTSAYASDCNSGGRYENMGDGTVTDCRTGLIWFLNANCTLPSNGITPEALGRLNWADAMKWVAGLESGNCGLTDGSAAGDWRLPTRTELMAMVEYARKYWSNPSLSNGSGSGQWTSGDVFTGVLSNFFYWSSTSSASSPGFAGSVFLSTGATASANKSGLGYSWPVRAGQAGSFGSLRIE
jgi:hypothetical protein